MIQLARITLGEIRLPLVDAFRTTAGAVDERRILLLQLRDNDGLSVWSECVAESKPGYSSETIDTAWAALSDSIVPMSLAQSFASANEAHAHFKERFAEHPMASASVEMALWALQALRSDRSLAALLASECADKAQPSEFVETGIALGMQSNPKELASRCEVSTEQGYRRIKIKIEPGRDVDYVAAARDSVPSHIALSVDANCSYSLAGENVERLEDLDRFGLSMIEQPLGRDDFSGHAVLQSRLATPICLDESIVSHRSVDEMVERRSARIVNLKPGRVGGFTESIAIHDRCIRAGVPMWCGGMLESGVGRAYNVALASLSGFTLPGDLSPSSRYWHRDIVTQPWTMDQNGRVRVPLDTPGIGVDVNESLVDDLTVRHAEFTSD